MLTDRSSLYNLLPVIPVVFLVFFAAGCVSAPSAVPGGAASAAAGSAVEPGIQQDAPAVYNPCQDWKSKGFGSSCPQYIITALDHDFTLLRAAFPAAAGKTVLVVYAARTNLDQAYSAAAAFDLQQAAEGFRNVTKLDDTWLYILPENAAGGMYLAARIYTADSDSAAAPGDLLFPTDAGTAEQFRIE